MGWEEDEVGTPKEASAGMAGSRRHQTSMLCVPCAILYRMHAEFLTRLVVLSGECSAGVPGLRAARGLRAIC